MAKRGWKGQKLNDAEDDEGRGWPCNDAMILEPQVQEAVLATARRNMITNNNVFGGNDQIKVLACCRARSVAQVSRRRARSVEQVGFDESAIVSNDRYSVEINAMAFI